jgi:hypothetical protein
MIATHSFLKFNQWLLTAPTQSAPVRTVILHGDPAIFSDRLIEDVAVYLNEYDDEGGGRWLAATSELVLKVSGNRDLRQLLGMAENCPNCPPSGPCGIRKTLTALGQRGHVIFRAAVPPGKNLELPNAFHAGIGSGSVAKCHLILNPDLMAPGSIANIIGDVFLEWLHRNLHRTEPALRPVE